MKIPERITVLRPAIIQALSRRASQGSEKSFNPAPARRKFSARMIARKIVNPVRWTDCTAGIPYLLSRTNTTGAQLEKDCRIARRDISELVRHGAAADDHGQPRGN